MVVLIALVWDILDQRHQRLGQLLGTGGNDLEVREGAFIRLIPVWATAQDDFKNRELVISLMFDRLLLTPRSLQSYVIFCTFHVLPRWRIYIYIYIGRAL